MLRALLFVAATLAFASARRMFNSNASPMHPLVTVVVSDVQQPQLLARVIELTARQTYPNIELLIFDTSAGTPTAIHPDMQDSCGMPSVQLLARSGCPL